MRANPRSAASRNAVIAFAIKGACVGNGNHAIPNRNKATPEVTLSIPVIPEDFNELHSEDTQFCYFSPLEARVEREHSGIIPMLLMSVAIVTETANPLP